MGQEQKTITAESAKKSAKYFYYGNIIAVLIPLPLFILWFGGSIMVYAMFRHFPNKRVGYYTQMAAYQFYALAGVLAVTLIFAPGDFFINYWWVVWGVCAAGLIPLALLGLRKINREQWNDIKVEV